MAATQDLDPRIRILVDEALQLSTQIRDELRAVATQQNVVVALVVTGLTAGAVAKQPAITVGAGLVAVMFAVYAVNSLVEVLFMGGRRRYLEERISLMAGQELLAWEQRISPRRTGWYNVWLNLAYAIPVVVVVAIVGREIYDSYDGWVRWALAAFLGAELSVTAYMFAAMRGAYDKAYSASKLEN